MGLGKPEIGLNSAQPKGDPRPAFCEAAEDPRAPREPEVLHALDRLEKEIEKHREVAGELVNRLGPVLSDERPGDNGHAIPDFGCPLASKIVELERRIRCATDALEDAQERLEV